MEDTSAMPPNGDVKVEISTTQKGLNYTLRARQPIGECQTALASLTGAIDDVLGAREHLIAEAGRLGATLNS